MIIKIKSENKYLLDILNKNPNTDYGLYMMVHRNGVLVGNVINENEYHIAFYDTKHSYTNYEDNQIDFKSFCDSKVILSIMQDFFSHLLKEREDILKTNISWLDKTFGDIDKNKCTIYVENIWVDSNWMRNDGFGNVDFLLSRYIDGITLNKKGYNLYNLEITQNNTLDAINLLTICSFFIQLTSSEESLYITDDLVKKYARILTNIKEVPYFVYYLFIKRVVSRNDKFWNDIKPYLEKSIADNLGLSCEFTKNDTHTDRIIYVRNNIDFSNTILDYGCGEFRYFKSLAKHVTNKFYSYDIDDYTDLYNTISERYKDKDWEFTTNLKDVPKNVSLSVIMSEVIEHNCLTKSKMMIEDLVNNYNVKQLIITTPNKDFNKYYNIGEDGVRREDHIQELSYQEFITFIESLNLNKNIISIEYSKISDCVDGDCVTSGVILKF
jgi:hypothetical protein